MTSPGMLNIRNAPTYSLLASLILLSTQAAAQLVEPEQWQPPIVNSTFSPIEWSAVPMTLDNLRIRDAADDIGFDLLRLDDTFGSSPGSIASDPFSYFARSATA